MTSNIFQSAECYYCPWPCSYCWHCKLGERFPDYRERFRNLCISRTFRRQCYVSGQVTTLSGESIAFTTVHSHKLPWRSCKRWYVDCLACLHCSEWQCQVNSSFGKKLKNGQPQQLVRAVIPMYHMLHTVSPADNPALSEYVKIELRHDWLSHIDIVI